MRKDIKKLPSSPAKHEKISYSSFLPKVLFLLGFLFISFLAFYHLGQAPLENWDEAWYADVTRNMLQTNQYVVMYWNETLWLDKPPLYMWLSSLVSGVIGLSEFSVRVPSAISGIIVVMLVAWFSYRNYGIVPAFLAFITLALNNVFVWRMRSGNIDLLATLLIFLIFLAQVSKAKYKYLFIGALFACLYLTRASLVLYPLIIFVLYEVFFERKNFFKKYKEYLKMIGIAIIIPAVWLLFGTLQAGPQFFQFFVFKSDHGVASIDLHYFSWDYVLYLYYSLQRRFAWVLMIGVLFALRYIKDPKAFLMLLYGAALLVQLSFTERSNNWYLLPAMPFWSLLIAYGTYHILKLFKNNIFLAALIFIAAAFLGYRTFITSIIPTLDSTANISQRESSIALRNLTEEGDKVVRLDHLYPTTVYYSERKVFSSPPGEMGSGGWWISRPDLLNKIRRHKVKWLIGTTDDVMTFQNESPRIEFKIRKVNESESIMEVL